MSMRSATEYVHTKAAEVSVLHHDARRDAFDFTSHFRDFYACLTRRGDTVFELCDAMLCEDGPMTSPVDLTPLAEHRRGHGALYDALNCGRMDVGGPRKALAMLPQPKAADGRPVLAVDVSPWLLPDAPCSPDRLFCHVYGRSGRSSEPVHSRLAVLVRRCAGDRPHVVVPASGRGPSRPRRR